MGEGRDERWKTESMGGKKNMKNCENSIESWAKGAIVGRNYKKVTPNPTKD